MEELNQTEKGKVADAMAREWSVHEEFKAVGRLTQAEVGSMMEQKPPPHVVDMRWVIVRKLSEFKARLAAIGCQERRGGLRSDSPAGSLLIIYAVVAYVMQPRLLFIGLDARAAVLQCAGRVLLLRLPAKCPPPGCVPNQTLAVLGAIYGTYDAGRQV